MRIELIVEPQQVRMFPQMAHVQTNVSTPLPRSPANFSFHGDAEVNNVPLTATARCSWSTIPWSVEQALELVRLSKVHGANS
jgi:hypothetical protein